MTISDAINNAITSMPKDFVIKPFLDAHKKDVYGMLLTEYNEAEAMQLFERDGFRKVHALGVTEGHAQGIAEGYSMLASLVRDGLISIEAAANAAGMDVSEFQKAAKRNISS